MKLRGPVPLSVAEDAESEYESGGKRKKVSSESKEVEEYMKRRQNALGGDAPTPPVSFSAPPSLISLASTDPGETML